MSTTFIDSAEDMQWLRDVHLPKLSARFNSALIKGNEDSPDSITVFEKNNPSIHTDDEGVEFTQDVNGKFKLAFDRQCVMDAYVVLAMYNSAEVKERLLAMKQETLDVASFTFFRSRVYGTQWEAIDTLCDASREHYFALLRQEIGEEGQRIVTNWERIHTVDSVEIKVTNSEDDPFTIQFEIHDVIASAWADAHGALKLDFSEWSDPDDEDIAIATHLGECPQCEGTDFAAAKKHVESLRS